MSHLVELSFSSFNGDHCNNKICIMNILTVLCIIFVSRGIISDKDVIPVFVMDYNNVMDNIMVDTNPFSLVSNAVFADIIYSAIKQSEIVLVFIEEQFSVEDVSIKDKFGSPYHYLHQGLLDDHVKYLPKVTDPYKALVKIFQPKQFNTLYLTSGTKIQIYDNSNNLNVFFRDGVNETRVAALRRHDMIMNEVINAATQQVKGNIVSFYTGKVNPVKVEKIEKVPIDKIAMNKPPGVMVVTDGALFKFKGVYAATHTRSAHFNQAPLVAEESWTSEALSTKMAYPDFELEFHFSFRRLSWMLDAVALLEDGEQVGRTEMAVGAPWKWAFYCSEPLVIINNRDGSSVTISEYKIQPLKHRRHSNTGFKSQMKHKKQMNSIRHKSGLTEALQDDDAIEDGADGGVPPGDAESTPDDAGVTPDDAGVTPAVAGESGSVDKEAEDGKDGTSNTDKFGDTVNCGPYFSSAILAALFVVGMFLLILSFGLAALYNCDSGDRFEDPHGKPLVISAEQ